jgi:uncharacterized phage protein (TIGR02220 family)
MGKYEVSSDNYITIKAFMVNELHLSGNELIVYAVIYGFSQDGSSWFTGSRKYLAAWCQTSEKSVTHNLKKLLDAGLIEKRTHYERGCTINDYRAIRSARRRGEETSLGGKKLPSTGEESSPVRGEESSPHTIEVDNLVDTIDIVPQNDSGSGSIAAIIDYLNERVGTHYTYRNKSINGLINARLSEGFTIDDFKTVVDNKVAEWTGTEWAKFLRPKTLFAPSHFEEYLNQSPQPTSYLDSIDWSAYELEQIDPSTIH